VRAELGNEGRTGLARSHRYDPVLVVPKPRSRQVRELLLIGAGGFAREAAEAVRAVNSVSPAWKLLGFLDDSPERQGTTVSGSPVLGPIEMAHDRPDAALIICTGRPDNYISRRQIVERLGFDDDRYATVIHPTASVGSTCRVGPGTVLLGHVDLTVDVTIGRHVAVMPQVILTHDSTVEDFATLAAGVRVGGGCHVADGAYIGQAACLRELTTIGRRAMVGMGSVVASDVPPERLWYGSPARDMAPAPLPDRPSAVRAKDAAAGR
jgi:sugar O-acyltransferase (sialic acid O-acetyltransferase NeuD family)